MKPKRRLLFAMLTAVVLLLTACGNSSNESSTKIDRHSPNINSVQSKNDDSDQPENDLDTEKNNRDTIESGNESKEGNSTNNTPSLKEDYLNKLNDTKKEMDEIRKKSEDEITYVLKNVEGNRFDVWDGLLNEVYEVLKKQLSSEEMEQLRKEQREWIVYRDSTAKKASLKYEGGTMEQLEYVIVLNNLTEARCFELVEEYMK